MTIVSFFIGMIIGTLAGFLAATLLATAAKASRETEVQQRDPVYPLLSEFMDILDQTRKFTAGAEIHPGETVVSRGGKVWPLDNVTYLGDDYDLEHGHKKDSS